MMRERLTTLGELAGAGLAAVGMASFSVGVALIAVGVSIVAVSYLAAER